jgi:hypothetical protein
MKESQLSFQGQMDMVKQEIGKTLNFPAMAQAFLKPDCTGEVEKDQGNTNNNVKVGMGTSQCKGRNGNQSM